MNEFFINLLFGHLVGDFVLQNKWMAVNKSASHFKCFAHCAIYTTAVTVFTGFYNLYWIAIIFGTHFLIDRYSLADRWLDLINGRSLRDFYYRGHLDIPKAEIKGDFTEVGRAYEGWKLEKNYQILRGGFTSVVYTVVDNTFHLLIGYYAWKFLQ